MAQATFLEPSSQLSISSRVLIQHYDDQPLNFLVADYAVLFPFQYDAAERIDLEPYLSAVFKLAEVRVYRVPYLSLIHMCSPYHVMLAVPFYPRGFDFIFRLGYIVRVASNITLLLMPALQGYCQRNGRFNQDCSSKRLIIRLHVALRTNPYSHPGSSKKRCIQRDSVQSSNFYLES